MIKATLNRVVLSPSLIEDGTIREESRETVIALILQQIERFGSAEVVVEKTQLRKEDLL